MNNTRNLISSVIISSIAAGCAAPKVTSVKKIQSLPVQFNETAVDSNSVGRLHFEHFFKDDYLVHLIKKVLENNFDNKIAAERIKIAEAYLVARRTALLPSVIAGLRASGTHYGKYTMEGVGNFDTNLSSNIEPGQIIPTLITPDYWLGLSASWEIDLWSRLDNLQAAAKAQFLSSQQGKELLTTALITHTATLYFELITFDREIEILNENIQLQEKALDIIKTHKEVGRATELAVQQFDAQLANTRAALYHVRQGTVATENRLMELCGSYNEKIERSKEINIKSINYLMNHGHPRQLVEYRPDIKSAYLELQASHANAKAARAAFFPSLEIGAQAGLHSFNAEKVFNPTSIAYQLLGGLTAPVFQRKHLKSAFNIAGADQEIAFLNYQKTVNSAFQEVKTLISYIDNNTKVLNEKNKEVSALNRGVEVANDLYVTAYANYLEIIAAQKSKITADMDLIRAKRDHAKALIQLYKALGGGANAS